MVQCTVHLSLAMLEREYAEYSSIVFESQKWQYKWKSCWVHKAF